MLLGKENPTFEEVAEVFKGDRFAMAAGCRPVEASEGHAVCELDIDPSRHYNLGGSVMGGVLFTLADFALAIACNYNREPTVSVTHTIEFMARAQGTKLIATADVDRAGRRLGFYHVKIVDDTGRYVAKMSATTAIVEG